VDAVPLRGCDSDEPHDVVGAPCDPMSTLRIAVMSTSEGETKGSRCELLVSQREARRMRGRSSPILTAT